MNYAGLMKALAELDEIESQLEAKELEAVWWQPFSPVIPALYAAFRPEYAACRKAADPLRSLLAKFDKEKKVTPELANAVYNFDRAVQRLHVLQAAMMTEAVRLKALHPSLQVSEIDDKKGTAS